MHSTPSTYDFIVVGGGPAGCALAASLAHSARRPRVLLLEAGGRNDDRLSWVYGKRWTTFMQGHMNWGYKTTPQEHCNGRQIDYSRGKGLGGSSAINFGVFTVGARDDYDQWATQVEDNTFGWEKMQERLKALENFDPTIQVPEHRKYASINSSDHGDKGLLHLSFANEWEKDLSPRTTASDLLSGAPENLIVVTDSPVQRVVMKGKRAIGVEVNGQQYLATREVVLSAGTLDTPKILMHTGIGPAKELQGFDIPVVHDLSAVGQGLRDHYLAFVILQRNPETNERNALFQDPAAMDAAKKLWEETGTGPWAQYGCQTASGWFKSDKVTSSAEFKALPESVQNFMNKETVPQYEIISHFPVHLLSPDPFPDYSYLCLPVFMMNAQSRGEVRLQSSNPNDPLLFDPRFLSHPFDRRASIEIFRYLLELTRHPAIAKDTVSTLFGPSSDSDEDILEFWRNNLSSSWHMTGTVKMGQPDEIDTAVDHRFRVLGIENLRVADMSVVPVLTNNHTQATAYLTGATCAEVLIREYDLDGSS
ncbi:Glucose-methanol-choline oxidoreductase [Penicillium alfredii]|uniref:Glucose-methanol-choline oxidoreductase n=1 Tax=Penicillium alfredii TaxID=1506179 RepID=A0A9W9KCY8_9EURO|nr:Glucose-methanol-choline oxidoreductase [Penicillium alfredii]KAJ5101278.1 Glucose-methanol-choline oxidoreductase [Penicillium alfredii]